MLRFKKPIGHVLMIVLAFVLLQPTVSFPATAEESDADISQTIHPMAAGENHFLAIKEDGTVWAWGDNGYGQLGTGTLFYHVCRSSWSDCLDIPSVQWDVYQQLGYERKDYEFVKPDSVVRPTQVRGTDGQAIFRHVVRIAAGDRHSLALEKDGTVWAWGDNSFRQLGIYGDVVYYVCKDGCEDDAQWDEVSMDDLNWYIENGYQIDGPYYDASETVITPMQVQSPAVEGMTIQSVHENTLTDVNDIAASFFHSMALKNDGTLWGWGQLSGDGESRSEIPWPSFLMDGVKTVRRGDAPPPDDGTPPPPPTPTPSPPPPSPPPSGDGGSDDAHDDPPPRCGPASAAGMEEDENSLKRVIPLAFERRQQADGTLTLRATVGEQPILKALQAAPPSAGQPATVVIDAINAAQSAVSSVCVSVPATVWEKMRQYPDSALEVKTPLGSIRIPAKAVNAQSLVQALSRKAGRAVDADDAMVQICIQTPDSQQAGQVQQLAKEKNMTPLVGPVNFSVEGVAGDTRVPLETDTYSTHVLVIGTAECPKDIDMDFSRIVGIRYDEAMGQLFHVPTTFAFVDGQILAKLKRPGSGLLNVMHHFKTFVDLPGQWAQKEIELLASKYITYGRTSQLFDPNFLINRAQFAALIVRAMGLAQDPELAAAVYPDVDVTDWYAGAAGAAYKAGLMTGSKGQFKSLRPITRREVVVVLARAYAYAGKPVQVDNPEELVAQFTDGNAVSWELEEMAQMIKAGVIRGDKRKYLWSGNNATRAHTIVMLKRFMEDAGFIAE